MRGARCDRERAHEQDRGGEARGVNWSITVLSTTWLCTDRLCTDRMQSNNGCCSSCTIAACYRQRCSQPTPWEKVASHNLRQNSATNKKSLRHCYTILHPPPKPWKSDADWRLTASQSERASTRSPRGILAGITDHFADHPSGLPSRRERQGCPNCRRLAATDAFFMFQLSLHKFSKKALQQVQARI